MKRVLLCIMLSTLSCSIFLDGPVKDPGPGEFPNCDDETAAPAGDIALTLLGGVVIAAAVNGYRESPGDDERRMIIVGSIGTATFATSAILGNIWSGRCGRLKRRYEQMHPTRSIAAPTQPLAAPTQPPPSPVAAEGAVGGVCYGNLTCNDGAFCDLATRVCRPGNRGRPGGECYPDGSCALDAQCRDGRCHQPPLRQCETNQHCPLGTRCGGDGQCSSP